MKKNPLLVAVAVVLTACGGVSNPTPVVSPTPAPSFEPRLLVAQSFDTQAGYHGFSDLVPRTSQKGTLTVVARWEPQPPEGQMYLFLLSEPIFPVVTTDGVVRPCEDFTCSQILARDMSSSSPKQIEYPVQAGDRIFFWVSGIEGHIVGSVEVWFKPDC